MSHLIADQIPHQCLVVFREKLRIDLIVENRDEPILHNLGTLGFLYLPIERAADRECQCLSNLPRHAVNPTERLNELRFAYDGEE